VIEIIIEKESQRKSLKRRIESSNMFEFVNWKVQAVSRLNRSRIHDYLVIPMVVNWMYDNVIQGTVKLPGADE